MDIEIGISYALHVSQNVKIGDYRKEGSQLEFIEPCMKVLMNCVIICAESLSGSLCCGTGS